MVNDRDSDAVELWRAYKASGDLEFRNKLVLRYSPLVKYVVGRVRSGLPANIDPADLVSEGVIGLMDAVEKFEPARNLQFQTYAVPRIRGAILDGLRGADWVPRSLRRSLRDIERARGELQNRLGRAPNDEEVASELNLSAAALGEIRSKASYVGVGYLDDMGVRDDASLSTADVDTDDEEVSAALVRGIRELPERDQIIMTLYYFESFTLSEIGQILKVTESRVSQLHARCTSTLRSMLAASVA
jgi:RNA polymerase sigma factor for flagellar operon FliA